MIIIYWHTKWSRVHASIRHPSICPQQLTRCCTFAAMGLAGRRYQSTAARHTAAWHAAVKCGKCHAVSIQYTGRWIQTCLTVNSHTHDARTRACTRAFNGPLFGTTQVSRYQKSKTNLYFTDARDSEWQWHQLGHMQVCTSLQTDNHASTTQFFTGRMPFLPPNQQCRSTEGKALSHK